MLNFPKAQLALFPLFIRPWWASYYPVSEVCNYDRNGQVPLAN
jgi:hypothetical protein